MHWLRVRARGSGRWLVIACAIVTLAAGLTFYHAFPALVRNLLIAQVEASMDDSRDVDWDAAMMETLKIGYDGVLMFEVANSGDPIDVLKRTAKARERLEKMFVTF